MGGCATKPRGFEKEQEAVAPVEAPAPLADATPATENNDGGEIKKEEPLIDVSEAAAVEAKPATEEAVEPPKEEKKEGDAADAAPETPVAAEIVKSDEKTDAPVVKESN